MSASASSADLQLALAHYRMMFPDIGSLGVIQPPATQPSTWWTEYGRVSSAGLSATLVTELTYEGGSHRGIENFDQKTLIRALLVRRAELDCTFDDLAFSDPAVTPRHRIGRRVWL